MRNGQQAAVARRRHRADGRARRSTRRSSPASTGARGPPNIVAALWPERCKALVSVSGYLIGNQEAGKSRCRPRPSCQWWYQFYFATERGRAGYEKYRHDFAKLIWQLASPKWDFDDATFDRSAASFDNPDHVDDRDPQLPLAARAGRGRARGTTTSSGGSPRVPTSRCPRSRSKATPTARRIPSRRPTRSEVHRAGTRTGRSPAASATTFRRKRRKRSPKPSSTSTPSERSSHVCDGLGCFLDRPSSSCTAPSPTRRAGTA